MKNKFYYLPCMLMLLLGVSICSCGKREGYKKELKEGGALLSSGKYEESIAIFNAIINKDPKNVTALFGKATALKEINQYGESLKYCNKAIEIDDKNVYVYLFRSEIFILYQDYENALNDCNKSIELMPNFSHCYHGRGMVYFYMGDYIASIDDFTKSISISKSQIAIAESYVRRSDSKAANGDLTGALNDLFIAEKTNPENPNIYYSRSVLMLHFEDYNTALKEIERSIKLRKNDSASYAHYGRLKAILKDYTGALEAFNNSETLNPDNPNTYLNRGIMYLSLNNKEKACEDFSKASMIGSPQAINLMKDFCRTF